MKGWLLIFFLCWASNGRTQEVPAPVQADSSMQDSVRTVAPRNDTALNVVKKDSIRLVLTLPLTTDSFRFRPHLFFRFTHPVRYTVTQKQWQGKEVLFYLALALLLFFAFLKNSFSRYLTDLFSAYFRTTVRQKQIKEQLMQSPLPSLLFNVFFLISGGFFASLVLQRLGIVAAFPFWLLAGYCALLLLTIYSAKFLVLKVLGWIVQEPVTIDAYIFVVFTTNKVLGIVLLPFSIALAFTYGQLQTAALTLSLVLLAALFFYRFFLSFLTVSQTVRIQPFHFLLYLAAFEVLPLLLINKALFRILPEIT